MIGFLAFLGLILMIVGGIMLLVAGWKESPLWGLGMLFLPIVSLLFLLGHWNEAKRGFFVQLAGFGLLMLTKIYVDGHR